MSIRLDDLAIMHATSFVYGRLDQFGKHFILNNEIE